MTDQKKATLVIEFDDEAAGASGTFPMILDPEAHPAGVNSGDEIMVRAMTKYSLASRGTTGGVLALVAPNLNMIIEELVGFINDDEATLTYPVHSIIERGWIGNPLGNVTINEQEMKCSVSGYGVYRVKYNTRYHLLRVTEADGLQALIVWGVDSEGRRGHLLIQPQDTSAVQYEPVIIEVYDYCSDLPVAGAQVYFNGSLLPGQTDQFGQIQAGNHPRGSYREIAAVKSGYKDTDKDALANDVVQIL